MMIILFVMTYRAHADLGGAIIPTLTTSTASGMAPLTVHVHGLSSGVGEGNELTARYEWNFGDGNAPFNTLVGWNAAHTFNSPGTYTITLKVINQAGLQGTATTQITVAPPNRSTIYVSPTGSDANSGTSPSSPIQSFAKAASMLANNRQILFQRGGTYATTSDMYINHQNLIIGAYGSGNLPVIYFTSGAQYANMINFSGAAQDVIIENLKFDSPFAPDNLIVRGLAPHGTNITVRNCSFGKVSYAMNCGGGGVNGLLSQSNVTGVIGAYYLWGEGPNHVHIGNVVGGSTNEHNIRFGGSSRILIAHNDLTNTAKSTIWCMLGDHAYIGNNVLREGRFLAGPNFALGSPSERFPWLVFENNQIVNEGIILYSGAEHMMFRNNVITYHGGDCFSIWGYIADMNRTVKNVTIANNTALNSSTQYGKFIKLGDGADTIIAANNLYCATALNQPNGAGNVVTDDPDLTSHNFHHNLWANSATSSYVHATGTGSKTVTQWATIGQTSAEGYRPFVAGDLNGQFVPQFNANVGVPVPGVRTDMYGTPRPVSGLWAVGAVEIGSSPTIPPSPDTNGDGEVNVVDLLRVIQSWGACVNPAQCPADVTHDGNVDTADLLGVLAAWS